MSELQSLVQVVAGLAALGATGALVTRCLRLRSPVEALVASYVIAWAWLVAVVLALSTFDAVTARSLAVALAVGVAVAFGVSFRFGHPWPSSRASGTALKAALRRPALAALTIAVALGTAYSLALALLTPPNEDDALVYHLPRAALWKQEHGVGYLANVPDLRLNASPPNAEIGQLATMLLSGSDRYVALPQLLAYAALTLCVAGLGRRLGLAVPEALLGALLFATLPVVALQASGALNDLVVASFLSIAVLFAAKRGSAELALASLALGLALGTKFTAVLALPTLAIVVALAHGRTRWRALAAAGGAGLVLGSTWYVVNLFHTGSADGTLAAEADQRVDVTAPAIVTNVLRFGLDTVDMSGLRAPYRLLLVPLALTFALLALRPTHSKWRRLALVGVAYLTMLPFFAPYLVRLGQSITRRTWEAFGRPETAPFERGWGLNVMADPTDSWYGPLGTILLLLGIVAIALLVHRRDLPRWSLALVAAPWVLLLSLAFTIAWDPWRGRFVVFGVALAAAAWGALLRLPVVPAATASLGILVLALSLASYRGKPSGLGELWPPAGAPFVRFDSVWDDRRAEVMTRFRGSGAEQRVYDLFETDVPRDAVVAVAVRSNDHLFPYFGSRLSRRVRLVNMRAGVVPADSQWLVLAPGARVRRCERAWASELRLSAGWRVESRIGPDLCVAGEP